MRKLVVLIALLAAAGSAAAASPGATLVRHSIKWSAKSGNRLTGASVSFYVPSSWRALKPRDRRHLSFHKGTLSCRYSVTFSSRLAPDTAQTPVQRVAAALPAAGAGGGRYLLDYGQRGSASAWRVIRVPATGQIRLRAMRADHRSTGNGAHIWQETVVVATSRPGSECHSGTYREDTGPRIGNALATATTRAYDFTTRG